MHVVSENQRTGYYHWVVFLIHDDGHFTVLGMVRDVLEAVKLARSALSRSAKREEQTHAGIDEHGSDRKDESNHFINLGGLA